MDNEHVEKVYRNGKLCALIVRGSLPAKGHQFVSDLDDPLQIGVVNYQEGEVVGRHYHPDIKRVIHANQETLYIESGGGTIVLYDDDGSPFCERQFAARDTIAFIHGGHKLTFFQDTRVIQVKQGPYVGPEKDKIYY